MRPLIEVAGLAKVYEPSPPWMRILLRSSIKRPVEALRDVSFTIEAGEISAVIGPNGAGKSTLFRIITGLILPTSGSVHVCGLDATRCSPTLRRTVGFLPADDRALFLRYSCIENLVFHGRVHGLPEGEIRTRAEAALDLVGLSSAKDTVGFALSSGMRARLQLARTLLPEPRVLILDEPTGAIDPLGSAEFISLVRDLVSERGLAALVSSHRLEEMDSLHDRVILLQDGHLTFDGPLDLLRERFYEPKVVVELEDVSMVDAAVGAVRTLGEIRSVDRSGTRVEIGSDIPVERILTALVGLPVSVASIGRVRPALTEVLLRVEAEFADRRRR